MSQSKAIATRGNLPHKATININKWEEVTCDLCTRNEASVLATENGFSICECNHCNLVYINPRPSSEDLKTYYEEYYPQLDDSVVEAWNDEKPFRQISKMLEQDLPAGGFVVDIGCGLGLFLKRLGESSPKWSGVGIDYDNKAIVYAQKMYSTERISFACVDIMEDISFLPDRVNAVTILACLEHMPSPQAFFKRLKRILTPGSRIYIRVPFNHFWIRFKNTCRYVPLVFGAPMHLYNFSASNLETYLAMNGFNEIKIFPGVAERQTKLTMKIASLIIKGTSSMLYIATGHHYIAPWVGSLVASGRYTG